MNGNDSASLVPSNVFRKQSILDIFTDRLPITSANQGSVTT